MLEKIITFIQFWVISWFGYSNHEIMAFDKYCGNVSTWTAQTHPNCGLAWYLHTQTHLNTHAHTHTHTHTHIISHLHSCIYHLALITISNKPLSQLSHIMVSPFQGCLVLLFFLEAYQFNHFLDFSYPCNTISWENERYFSLEGLILKINISDIALVVKR